MVRNRHVTEAKKYVFPHVGDPKIERKKASLSKKHRGITKWQCGHANS
jgi:hypothetical protein